jgi:flavoprotein
VSETGEPRATTLACSRCKQALAPAPVAASYLGNRFPIELLKCPGCGRVYVPEALATGKMAQVEQLLEDK